MFIHLKSATRARGDGQCHPCHQGNELATREKPRARELIPGYKQTQPVVSGRAMFRLDVELVQTRERTRWALNALLGSAQLDPRFVCDVFQHRFQIIYPQHRS
jgi:hypothetical protein